MMISDAILPLGKVQPRVGEEVPELTLLNGHTLLAWALEEALRAGARRILLTAPETYAEAQNLEILARKTVAEASVRDKPPIELVTADPARLPEGWDGLIRLAAESCRGHRALLIDPLMPLMVDGQVLSSVSLQMRQAMEGRPDRPRILACNTLPWEEALTFPRLREGGKGGLGFMAETGDCDQMQTVFAGRAIFGPVLPEPDPAINPDWPSAYRFAYETIMQHILSDGAEGFATDAALLDFTAPDVARRKQVQPVVARSPGRRFALRVRPNPTEEAEEIGRAAAFPPVRLEFASKIS